MGFQCTLLIGQMCERKGVAEEIGWTFGVFCTPYIRYTFALAREMVGARGRLRHVQPTAPGRGEGTASG